MYEKTSEHVSARSRYWRLPALVPLILALFPLAGCGGSPAGNHTVSTGTSDAGGSKRAISRSIQQPKFPTPPTAGSNGGDGQGIGGTGITGSIDGDVDRPHAGETRKGPTVLWPRPMDGDDHPGNQIGDDD